MNFNEVAAKLLLMIKGMDGKSAISTIEGCLKDAYNQGILDSLPVWGEGETPTRSPDNVLVNLTKEEFDVVVKVIGKPDAV